MITVVLFVFGAILASFVGLIASRHHTGLSSMTGRSRCLSCEHELGVRELIPIVSFVLSRGRCAHCGVRIPWTLPFSEVFMGLSFAALFSLHGFSPLFFLWALFLLALLFLLLYDIAHMMLPAETLYGSVALGLLIVLFSDDSLLLTVVGASLIALFFYALHVFSRGRALGFGDVVLVLALSLAVGAPSMWIGALLSFWIGALVGISVLFVRFRRVRMGMAIPFGPFLITGFICAYFFQDFLVDLSAILFGPLL